MNFNHLRSFCRRNVNEIFVLSLILVPWGVAIRSAVCQEPAVEESVAADVLVPQDPAPAVAGDKYELDNAHTSVVFAVSHFGLSYTYGRFNECSGSFALQSGEPTESGFSFVIKADSVDTNNGERDKHLRGPDFFDTQQFPEIKFVTTSFKKVGMVYEVTGDFTMLGQTRQVTMPIQTVGIGKGPFGKQRAGYFTKFTIKRSDFGMNQMIGQVGDNIAITFSFEGIKQ